MKQDTRELLIKLYEFDDESRNRILEEARHYLEVQDYAEGMRKKPTDSERKLGTILKYFNISNIPQEVIETIDNHYYIADFAVNNNLLIEVDGGYHQLEEQVEKDKKRTANLEKKGYNIIRLTNEEIDNFSKIWELICFLKLNNLPVRCYNNENENEWVSYFNNFTESGKNKNCGEKVLNKLKNNGII